MHTSLQFVPWLYHDCASLQTPQEGKLRDPLNRATTSRMVNRALGHRTEFQPHFLNQQTNKQSACGGNYLLGSWKLGQEPSASSHRPRHPSRARGILPQGSPALSPGAWTLAGSSQLWLGLGKNVWGNFPVHTLDSKSEILACPRHPADDTRTVCRTTTITHFTATQLPVPAKRERMEDSHGTWWSNPFPGPFWAFLTELSPPSFVHPPTASQPFLPSLYGRQGQLRTHWENC